jgi:Cu(I)/Ag(I) efflux system membrane fusion protein
MDKKFLLVVAGALSIGLLTGYFVKDAFTTTSEPSATHQHEEGTRYTCSMHPQINQPEPGSCPICGMALIPVPSNDGQGQGLNEVVLSPNALALSQIETQIVGGHDGHKTSIMLSGTLALNEDRHTVQTAEYDGRIEQLLISSEGQYVTKGQVLARVYSPVILELQQELLTAAKLKEQQPDWYQAVRNKLRLLKFSDEWIDALESDGKTQDTFDLVAESSGTITKLVVEEGAFVSRGRVIAEIADLSRLWVRLEGYEDQLYAFQKGQKVVVSVASFPSREFDATVTFIDPVLNSQSRVTEIRAELSNSEGMLKPGMFVKGEVKVASTQNKNPLTVPSTAVLWTGERSVVYVQPSKEIPNFVLKTVVLGEKHDGYYEVVEGLEPRDRVVVNGAFVIDASAQLKGQTSMMNNANENASMTLHLEEHNKGSQKQFTAEDNAIMAALLPHYLRIKNALVNSDAVESAQRAKESFQLVKSETNEVPAQGMISHIERMLKTLSEQSDLENQRHEFIALSAHFIDWASQGLTSDETLYVQFCPMANDNQGAQWLSTEEEIRNPYYGDAMLSCGSIVEVLSIE